MTSAQFGCSTWAKQDVEVQPAGVPSYRLRASNATKTVIEGIAFVHYMGGFEDSHLVKSGDTAKLRLLIGESNSNDSSRAGAEVQYQRLVLLVDDFNAWPFAAIPLRRNELQTVASSALYSCFRF
ncbi:hypothetical protein B0B52_17385 [Polaromonas sp. A23]|nr:hypothetical protein B0B52_17385 [Polaromonas sp. A23]